MIIVGSCVAREVDALSVRLTSNIAFSRGKLGVVTLVKERREAPYP